MLTLKMLKRLFSRCKYTAVSSLSRYSKIRSLSCSLPTPLMYSESTPAATGGVGSTVSAGIRRTSDTASTMKPTTRLLSSMTIIRVSLSWAMAARPKRRRRSTIGMTLPRRLMTPSTNSGERGTLVISMIRMISCTFRIFTPNSSSSMLNVTNCSSDPFSFFRISSIFPS